MFRDEPVWKAKKLNIPHVLRDGGRGMRSRLLHASVCSCLESLPERITASFALRRTLTVFDILLPGATMLRGVAQARAFTDSP